ADARPAVAITDAAGAVRIRRLEGLAVGLIDVSAPGEPKGLPAPAPWLTPASLAYVIYTSGTTGRPKGVMIEHRGIVNLIRGDAVTFPVSPDDRVGQNSSCAYVSSVEEVRSALSGVV